MKRLLACLALVLLLIPLPARGDGLSQGIDALSLAPWQEIAGESGLDLDVRALMEALARGDANPDWPSLIARLEARLRQGLFSLRPAILLLAGPALMASLCRRLLGGGLSGTAGLVCRLTLMSSLLSLFLAQFAAAREALLRIGKLADAVSPVLLSLVTLGGASAASGVMQPLYALMTGGLAQAVCTAALSLSSCACAVAVAGRLSPEFPLTGLYRLLKSACNWLLGLAMGAFTGVLGVGSLWGATRDGIAMRAARFTASNLLPGVGGEVAGALDAVALSTTLIRGAAGVTALVLLAGICIVPMLRLGGCVLSCRLAAALAEPLFGGEEAACLNDFAGALGMLLSALACAAVMLTVMAGSALWTGALLLAMH